MAQSADADLLRQRLRTRELDAYATHCLDAATSWVLHRVTPDQATPGLRRPEVTDAILLLASRLEARRRSPEGVAGWGDLGVVRVVANDPDLARELELLVDMTRAGIA